MELPAVVSLFSGAGGLDLGFHDAGFRVAYAVDSSPAAIQTHRKNFRRTASFAADLIELQPEGVLNQLEPLLEPGAQIGVIGGPPCQGFSRANTGSRANDPRNKLPMLYLAIVAALQDLYDVQFVMFENVSGIRDSKHAVVFGGILDRFRELELHARVEQFSALDFGVPQLRNRVIISGFANAQATEAFEPKKVPRAGLTVRSTIGALPPPVFYSRGLLASEIPYHPNHWTMRPLSKRFEHPDGTGAGRSFRRLEWDKPSPTVAYGHREIHVHPGGSRRLSIFEAMLLQGFPTGFVLQGSLSAQVEQVSNAVPPPMARALAEATRRSLLLTEPLLPAVARPSRVRNGH
jgi:DNA (cytosine-5)-methyltransferase 1